MIKEHVTFWFACIFTCIKSSWDTRNQKPYRIREKLLNLGLDRFASFMVSTIQTSQNKLLYFLKQEIRKNAKLRVMLSFWSTFQYYTKNCIYLRFSGMLDTHFYLNKEKRICYLFFQYISIYKDNFICWINQFLFNFPKKNINEIFDRIIRNAPVTKIMIVAQIFFS